MWLSYIMAEVSCDSCSGLNFLYSAETVEVCEGESEPQILQDTLIIEKLNMWKSLGCARMPLVLKFPAQQIAARRSVWKCSPQSILKKSGRNLRNFFMINKIFISMVYFSGIKLKKWSGHTHHETPAMTSDGKRLGRPPAEESVFSLDRY